MFRNVFLILVVSAVMLYYSIFKIKDRLWRILGIIASISSLLVFVARFFQDRSNIMNTLIGTIINFVIFTGLFLTFFMISVIAWELRNDPQKKKAVYFWFGLLAFLILSIIVIIILNQLGVFG